MTKKETLPPLAPEAFGRNGFKYRSQHGVVLVCTDEAQQQKLYEALEAIKKSRIKVVVA